RRRAVDIKLRLHPDWSDRRLSEDLGVSRDLISKVRKSLVEGGQIPAGEGRVGTDGKTYPAIGLTRDTRPGPETANREPRSDPDDPRDRGRSESDLAPWEEEGPSSAAAPARVRPDFKAQALAEMPDPSTPTIDELLNVMVGQIGEVVAWTRSDGFADAIDHASKGARNALRLAVNELVMQCEELGI
ncbi:MAG: transcriptional regulator, partial [Isosphaeraceae bacterium]